MSHKRLGFLCLVMTILCLACSGYAEKEEEASCVCRIQVNGPTEVASQLIQTSVTISLENEQLRNDALYLSYHIYSETGELLHYEGERTLLTDWKEGEVTIPIEINLTSYGTVPLNGNVRIEFDIADVSGGYWFSTNDAIQLDADAIGCKGDILNRFKESAVKAIHRPVAIVMNLASIVVFVVILKKLKKNDFSII